MTNMDILFSIFIGMVTMALTNLALVWLHEKWKERQENKIYALYVNGENKGDFPLAYIKELYEKLEFKSVKYMTHNPKSATAVILIDHIKGEE